MIRLGGGSEQPEYFAMGWQGQVVKFRAYVNLTHNVDPTTYTAHWDIGQPETPPGLKDQRDKVLKLLVEGLNAMGNSICDHNGIATVNVTLGSLMTEAESL